MCDERLISLLVVLSLYYLSAVFVSLGLFLSFSCLSCLSVVRLLGLAVTYSRDQTGDKLAEDIEDRLDNEEKRDKEYGGDEHRSKCGRNAHARRKLCEDVSYLKEPTVSDSQIENKSDHEVGQKCCKHRSEHRRYKSDDYAREREMPLILSSLQCSEEHEKTCKEAEYYRKYQNEKHCSSFYDLCGL